MPPVIALRSFQTIASVCFCNIPNSEVQGKCYQLQVKGLDRYITLIEINLVILNITKTKSNNN